MELFSFLSSVFYERRRRKRKKVTPSYKAVPFHFSINVDVPDLYEVSVLIIFRPLPFSLVFRSPFPLLICTNLFTYRVFGLP